MRNLLIIIGAFVLLFGAVILGLEFKSLKHSGDILEFEHPSDDIEHSLEKEIFIDSLEIASADTIKIKEDKIWLFPVEAWLEKKPYWKSHMKNLDSLGFLRDTVVVVVNFAKSRNGRPWTPQNSGFHVSEIICVGQVGSIYVDDKNAQVDFNAPRRALDDSVELITLERERIVLKRGTH